MYNVVYSGTHIQTGEEVAVKLVSNLLSIITLTPGKIILKEDI